MLGLLFNDFDSRLLDDAGFKEDSVREELIAPLLKALGYSAAPQTRFGAVWLWLAGI